VTIPYQTKPHENKKEKSFGVAPSPFNVIKLELGIIIVVCLLLLLGVDSITHNTLIQLALLFVAGVLSMVWIVWRTHILIKRQSELPAVQESNDGNR
jgi:Na+(H+)/acetate symporter ActP